MKRSNYIVGLALKGNGEYASNISLPLDDENMYEEPLPMGSPVAAMNFHSGVHKQSPLTKQQELVVAELENIGFSTSDDFLKDHEISQYSHDVLLNAYQEQLSVNSTSLNKHYEEQDKMIDSVVNEQQLTPLFTPIPSVQPQESPISTSSTPSNLDKDNCDNLSNDVFGSDDSVKDPDYLPESEVSKVSVTLPLDLTTSFTQTPSSNNSANLLEMLEIPLHENEASIILPVDLPASSTQTPQSMNNPNPQDMIRPSIVNTIDNNCVENTTNVITKRNNRKMTDKWKKNQRIKKRNCGEEYINTKGEKRPARKCSTENCKCQQACHSQIDQSKREQLFKSYWSLGNINRQRDYIIKNVTSTESTNRVIESRRKFTLNYSFLVDSKKVSVCQPYFLRTLDISDKIVRTALEKARRGVSDIPSPDKRGRRVPVNKYSASDINFANEHIDLFPTVPSHWCRKSTNKIYLESTLNKEKMYDLYKKYCLEKNRKCICKTSYKELLIKKNIGFHLPRKDQCWCHKYEELTEEEQIEKQEEYEEHINRKEYAKEEKKSDKIKATDDSKIHVCTFDFEAVLYSPLVLGKPVFYKRKLGSMNFTIHDAVTKQGYCYFWPEYEGNRGANEVSTCLYNYITNLTNVDHLILYSDCCPGQNRNSILIAMLNLIIASPDNSIKLIDYKFLEPGHTYMECDNMHSTIERASEFAKIYTPDEWKNVIRLARRDNPYTLQIMDHSDFLDFKKIRDVVMPKTCRATDGTLFKMTMVRWIRLQRDNPNSLFFKYDYWEEFKQLKLKNKTRVTKTRSENHSRPAIPKLYSAQIPIKHIKHKDLMSMCQDGTIPKNYHHFYERLPVEEISQAASTSLDNDELELSATRASYLKRRTRSNK